MKNISGARELLDLFKPIMKKPIKVIKRGSAPAPETPIPSAPAEISPTSRQAERRLHETVTEWIEERRRNDEAETTIATAHLLTSRA